MDVVPPAELSLPAGAAIAIEIEEPVSVEPAGHATTTDGSCDPICPADSTVLIAPDPRDTTVNLQAPTLSFESGGRTTEDDSADEQECHVVLGEPGTSVLVTLDIQSAWFDLDLEMFSPEGNTRGRSESSAGEDSELRVWFGREGWLEACVELWQSGDAGGRLHALAIWVALSG